MKKRNLKLLSTILSLSVFVTTLSPITVKASGIENEVMIASNMPGERTDINYIEGIPGSTHLVYTYEQNDTTYKVVEDSTEDFQSVNTSIYKLDVNNTFIKDSVQQVDIDSKGNPKVTITSSDGEIEHRTIDTSSVFLQSDGFSSRATSEWTTQYLNGTRGGLKGLTISTLISVISSIAIYYSTGTLTVATVSGASSIAAGLFNRNSEKVYYHAIYNWRHSPKNYLVTDETEWTEFFLDSGHAYSLGNTYAECIF